MTEIVFVTQDKMSETSTIKEAPKVLSASVRGYRKNLYYFMHSFVWEQKHDVAVTVKTLNESFPN